MTPEMSIRYRDALHPWASTRNSKIREGERTLKAIEEEILDGEDLGDGIDPVLLAAMGLPGWLSGPGVERRMGQIRAESGDATADWVLGKTEFEYQRHAAITRGRTELVESLIQIERSLATARTALRTLDSQHDSVLTEDNKRLLGTAIDQIQLLTAGASTAAPQPEASFEVIEEVALLNAAADTIPDAAGHDEVHAAAAYAALRAGLPYNRDYLDRWAAELVRKHRA